MKKISQPKPRTLADIITGIEEEYKGYTPLLAPQALVPAPVAPVPSMAPDSAAPPANPAQPQPLSPSNAFLLQCLQAMSQLRAKRVRTVADVHAVKMNIAYELVNHGREPRGQNTRFKIRFTNGSEEVILPQGGEYLMLWHVVR